MHFTLRCFLIVTMTRDIVLCPFYFDDLANMMDNTISESFRADFFDDSVEEVIISSLLHVYHQPQVYNLIDLW